MRGLMAVAALLVRRILNCTTGSMTIPAIVFFTALMAVGGLAIDMQRVYGAHAQMQAYVDNAALAGATELDGQSGAITRAFRAAKGDGTYGPLVTGTQNFASDTSLAIQKVTILSTLGADPGAIAGTPVGGDTVLCTWSGASWAPSGCDSDAAKDKSAKFIEVVAEPRTISYFVLPVANVFRQVFTSGQLQTTLALKATAGFKNSICDLTPMMICNPSEPTNNTDTNYPYAITKGQQILLRSSGGAGGGGAWTPGDFGWVNIPTNAGIVDCVQGSNIDIGCVLGLINPLTQCFNNGTIDVQPGQSTPTADGLNVRFDIYPNSDNLGPAHGVSTDSRFAPSVNVTKGICNVNGGVCRYSNGGSTCPNPTGGAFSLSNTVSDTNARATKLPRDAQWCDGQGNCQSTPDQTHRFGNSSSTTPTWDGLSYWKSNHCPTCTSVPANFPTTRYDLYRHEINCTNLGGANCFTGAGITDGIPNFSSGADDGEDGNHVGSGNGKWCSNQAGVNTPLRDRRVLFVAVINCHANSLNGNSSKSGVSAVAYLKIFLTEAVGFDTSGNWVGDSNSKDVYGEVVDIIKPTDQSNVVKVYPVLYR